LTLARTAALIDGLSASARDTVDVDTPNSRARSSSFIATLLDQNRVDGSANKQHMQLHNYITLLH
jgi:hypothetical protein